MKNTFCKIATYFLFGFSLLSRTQGQSHTNEIETDPLTPSTSALPGIHDPTVTNIVDSIEKLLAPVKGYTAKVESQGLDPNGGIDQFQDEQTVSCPTRMLIKRKVLQAHNSDAVGENVTIVIDGTRLSSRIERDPLTSEQKRSYERMVLDDPSLQSRTKEEKDKIVSTMLSYAQRPSHSKVNLEAVAKAGGPSVREYVAMTGNLADPLTPYKLDTLKFVSETPDEWVLLAEYKQKGAPWQYNRLTIDRRTGFLKQAEAIIPDAGPDQSIMLIKVKKVSPTNHIDDSLFKAVLPAPDSTNAMFVLDNTDMVIEDIKSQQTIVEKQETQGSQAK